MSGMTTGHAVPTILAATAATLLLAACGGSNNNDGSAGQSDDAKRLAFEDCMRKAGLEVEHQTSGRERATAIRIPKGVSPARLQKIQRDCARKTGGGPKEPSKAEQAKFLDQALKFARCMRAHGIDMPDPQAQGGGIRIGGPRSSRGGVGKDTIDPKSPAFQRAQKECESFLPGGKGGMKFSSKGGPTSGSAGGGDKPSNDAVVE
jgi:hypothetical protein